MSYNEIKTIIKCDRDDFACTGMKRRFGYKCMCSTTDLQADTR